MKILRVHIRNLNSLRGDHWVDFTAPPLADHSLYAIVGPTGAGKTTILDAITLALYGQTERNKSEVDRKDGSGTVLTYGEGECMAELEYEVVVSGKTERFRSAWTRQRAHKKPDANLTASKHSISQFDPQAPSENPWKILATKKREVAEKTQEIVGLDYERFVRSVMLTQGDFARFLKSDTGNKAEILEKITGTEIYRDLSVAAFTRAKLAREAHERATEALATMPPLASEDRQRLDDQVITRKAELEVLKEALAAQAKQLGLYDSLAALKVKSAAAVAESIRLEKAFDEAKEDRERLAKSEDLQPLRSDLQSEVRLESEIQQLAADTATTKAKQEELEAAVAAAGREIVAAQDKLNDYYEKLPAREKKIAIVADLEREIAALSRDLELDGKRQESTAGSLKERKEKQAELNASVTRLRKDLAGMEPEQIREHLAKYDEEIPAETKKIEALDQRIVSRKLADRIAAETTVLRKTEEDLAAATAALNEAEKAFAAAEENLADRRLVLNNLRLSASLAEHKLNLKPGENCPVCGATDHPALENFTPVTDSAIERTKADVNKALDLVENQRQYLKTARQNEAAIRSRHEHLATLIGELTTQLGPETPAVTEPLEELQQQRAALAEKLRKYSTEQARLRALQTKLPALTAFETELVTVASRVTELEAELAAVTGALAGNNKQLTQKKDRIKAEVGDLTAEQCREMTRKKKDGLTAALAAAEKAEIDRRGQLSALTSRQSVLAEQTGKLTNELMVVRARLATSLAERKLTSAAAREALLPETEALHLRERLSKLAGELATANTVNQNLKQETEAATAAVADLPDRDALDKSRAQSEFKISEADRLIGALELQIRQDDERIIATAEKRRQLEGLRKEMDRWTVMSKLIGSADGKKFRSYAQAITLQRLIDVGNSHLGSISPRYRMEYAAPEAGGSENLEIIISDTYHDENKRTMATLSGGETFLISLALALGLSDLASGKNLIQSLFIDEGFGTLDGKTLEKAMTTLEQLRDQGKTIGLISHVASLRERIYCQIRLEPVGDGFSTIVVSDEG
ncbi:AAA family ATPase [Neolewinella aurantiaca]|uniref:AAA family ATPase n=1 Tax=Neolewinella aurantiaca TaxID=2602767 RepID=A0A5C7FWV5_9BACT|nr:AAA family ATPase [Neolewinella aurantiaca]TXF91184.1 AAA family ATPase [Neolewinella aurantiaca]